MYMSWNRLREAEAFDLHDKVDHVTTGLAAEAVKQLMLRVHGKGRGFFAMERAETPMLPTVFFQTDITGNNLHDIGSGAELVHPRRRISGSQTFHLTLSISQNAGKEEGTKSF